MRSIKFIGGMLCLLALTGTAWAQESTVELPQLRGEYLGAPLVLTSNDSVVLVKNAEPASTESVPAVPYESSMFTGSKMHQYLGIATVAAAAATFATHFHPCEGPSCGQQPPRNTHGTHANLGRATAVLALATVASGLLTHWDDFHTEDGIADPDNMHVLLGVTGAAMMAYAINKSANSTVTPTRHAALAEMGALSMIVAIKLTW